MRLTKIIWASRKIPENYHNMPKRFIERQTTFLSSRAPRLPQYEKKLTYYKKFAYYDEWRPWQNEFQKLNQINSKMRPIFVEPIRDWPYFRGDRVEVLRGPDKGKQGIINYIVKERNWVYVQGLNLERILRSINDGDIPTIVCKECPYLVNHDVKLVDPSDLMPTDVEWRYDDNGERVRVSKRTERVIPIPKSAYETVDYTEAHTYKEAPKDTPEKEVLKVTFEPKAKTFEMDICDEFNIKEDRIPYPTYWY